MECIRKTNGTAGLGGMGRGRILLCGAESCKFWGVLRAIVGTDFGRRRVVTVSGYEKGEAAELDEC
jgi:hypothetical protein